MVVACGPGVCLREKLRRPYQAGGRSKQRRGRATFPEIDLYWNKDFGYGMVDALGAVQLAQHLNASNQSAGIDPWLQNHLLDVNVSGSIATITGHAWAQQGTIERVEFRHGHGEWSEATYETPLEELTPGQPFNWTVVLDIDLLEDENAIRFRYLDSDIVAGRICR